MPVFIHHFPAAIKAFYFKRDAQNDELALGCDLIAPDGYGGSYRWWPARR
jgi:asparaginyl-tRNA synthetase